MKNLESLLKRVDGKGYKAYKDIKGTYKFNHYDLNILYVQGDPFASPSLFEIECNLFKLGFAYELFNTRAKKVAFEDFILRRVYKTLVKLKSRGLGSGKSGEIYVYKPSCEIIKRSACEIKEDKLRIKVYLGLPAKGRRVLAKEALFMINEQLPKVYEAIKNIDMNKLEEHVEHNETIENIRVEMKKKGIMTFIANGSILARESSVSERPLRSAVPFESPSTLSEEILLDNGVHLKGMGIKEGITVISGGGFHGKSTLLNAIEKGVYNHILGDGREYVITRDDACKIRAEDGRSVNKVNISSFIDNLPFHKDTKSFSTPNASGSTSQASNIVEAIEIGSKLLLIDEDTSATNFMIRDKKVEELISKDKEPITPFLSKIKSLYERNGVSSIVVVGGLGDYFAVADNILVMDNYQTKDKTKKAKEIIAKYKDTNILNDTEGITFTNRQLNVSESIKIFNDKKDKVKHRDMDHLLIGKDEIDLRSIEQLVETGQVNFVGELIKIIFRRRDLDKYTLRDILDTYENRLLDENICEILDNNSGNISYARKFEIGAAINRLRREIFN